MRKEYLKYGLIAVALILTLALTAAGCSIPGIVEPEPGDEEPELIEEVEEDREENDLDMDRETEEKEKAEEYISPGEEVTVSILQGMSRDAEQGARPKTRTLEIEGDNGKEEKTFRLLNLPSLPFSTYIPGEPDTSPYFLLGHDHLWGEYQALPQDQEIVIVGRSDGGRQLDELETALEILPLEPDLTEEEAWEQLKKGLGGMEELKPLKSDLPAWVQDAHVFVRDDGSAGFLVLGHHEEYQFGLRSTWLQGQKESWLARVRPILEQWTWDEQTAQRPSEQVFTTFVEGTEKLQSYCLVQHPDMPATTYFPCDRKDRVQEVDAGSAKGIRMEYMDLMFWDEDITERGAEASFQQVIGYMGALESVSGDEALPPWALEKYRGLHGDRSMGAILGEHEGRYFYLREEYPVEAGDGWYPLRSLIINQLRWKETGAPLGQQP